MKCFELCQISDETFLEYAITILCIWSISCWMDSEPTPELKYLMKHYYTHVGTDLPHTCNCCKLQLFSTMRNRQWTTNENKYRKKRKIELVAATTTANIVNVNDAYCINAIK